MKYYKLEDFVRESNKIEGIAGASYEEILAHMRFLESDATIADLEQFVSVVAPGHVLRDKPGLNVRVGNHIPPMGGPDITRKLESILGYIKLPEYVQNPYIPFRIHCEYETLHPFTDGNGRSGRALWLWMMQKSEHGRAMVDRYGFLHSFYYQTLDASDGRK